MKFLQKENNNIKTLFWLYFLLLQNQQSVQALTLPCTHISPGFRKLHL